MALPTASDNPFPSVLVTETAAASISSPAAGKQRLFVDTDHVLKYKNSAGTVSAVDTSGAGAFVAKQYFNKPAGDITRATTTIGAFSTAWQITGVVVASGQNVRLDVSASASGSIANSNFLLALFRDSTQIASTLFTSSTASNQACRPFTWIDENPGAATYTYEVRAAQFTSGTLTVYQTNITTNVTGGSSIFVAEVYTP